MNLSSVVFRRPSTVRARTLPRATVNTLATIDGPWTVSFPSNLGAPAKITLAKLQSWTANADDGVKYFSGTATYTKIVQVDRSWLRPDERILFDLGAVKDLAEVSVNGQAVGTRWKSPYQIDVTDALKPGSNQLEIKVTNQWTNRLIGDRLATADKRVLAEAVPGFGPPPTLKDSGLLGPVAIVSVANPFNRKFTGWEGRFTPADTLRSSLNVCVLVSNPRG